MVICQELCAAWHPILLGRGEYDVLREFLHTQSRTDLGSFFGLNLLLELILQLCSLLLLGSQLFRPHVDLVASEVHLQQVDSHATACPGHQACCSMVTLEGARTHDNGQCTYCMLHE